MRTEQDKINRKDANQRYYRMEENKQQKRDYMKEYRKRPHVREKYEAKLKRKKLYLNLTADDPNNHDYE